MDDFWHKNLDRIPDTTGSFIKDFASATLPIKATEATEAIKNVHEAKKKL